MQFIHFLAFSNSNGCSLITEVSSINAPRKPVKVSEAGVQEIVQQPAENSQWSEIKICIYLPDKAEKKAKPKTSPQPIRWPNIDCSHAGEEARKKGQDPVNDFHSDVRWFCGKLGQATTFCPSYVEAGEEETKHKGENQPSVPCAGPTP